MKILLEGPEALEIIKTYVLDQLIPAYHTSNKEVTVSKTSYYSDGYTIEITEPPPPVQQELELKEFLKDLKASGKEVPSDPAPHHDPNDQQSL